jgi:uncharacterized protein YgiM (DUF1202 family)
MSAKSFTHKLNCNHQPASAPEIWKGHPVTLLSVSGEYSKVLVNNNEELFIPSEFLTEIKGVK